MTDSICKHVEKAGLIWFDVAYDVKISQKF